MFGKVLDVESVKEDTLSITMTASTANGTNVSRQDHCLSIFCRRSNRPERKKTEQPKESSIMEKEEI